MSRKTAKPRFALPSPNGVRHGLPATPPWPLRLDLGCGPNPADGFEGVDLLPFGGKVRHLFDLRTGPWPFADDSVDEARAVHFLEHLTNLEGRWERVRFFNQLYRVLKPGAGCSLVFPHWCSNRYYGDPTHKEPFSEMGFYYLSREWRLGDPAKGIPGQAPHTDVLHNPDGYACDFEATWGYGMHPALTVRNAEYQQDAMQWKKEAVTDIMATVKARK